MHVVKFRISKNIVLNDRGHSADVFEGSLTPRKTTVREYSPSSKTGPLILCFVEGFWSRISVE